MCLATMAYVYTACTVRVTIFSTGGKFCLISNFVGLHVLTLAAHSYVLLCDYLPYWLWLTVAYSPLL